VDKKRKNALRQQYKVNEQAEAQRALGLSPVQLDSLRAYLRNVLRELKNPCDHTLTHTRQWATENGLDPVRVAVGVNSACAFCDCEVLLNVTPDQFGFDKLADNPPIE
jgi:hypothetical protein